VKLKFIQNQPFNMTQPRGVKIEGRLQRGAQASSMSQVYGHSTADLPYENKAYNEPINKRSSKMTRMQFLTKTMMMSLMVFIAVSNVNAQHMGDNHQDQDQMSGDQTTQHMHENMQNMQQMQQSNMMTMDGQSMMMSMEEMMEHMSQLMNHSEAMLSSLEDSGDHGLMSMFRGDDSETHMMEMTEDMTEMMTGMNGLMENMQSMMGDQDMMSEEGMQMQMDNMQSTLNEMVASMDQMMDNMHNIQKLTPKVKK